MSKILNLMQSTVNVLVHVSYPNTKLPWNLASCSVSFLHFNWGIAFQFHVENPHLETVPLHTHRSIDSQDPLCEWWQTVDFNIWPWVMSLSLSLQSRMWRLPVNGKNLQPGPYRSRTSSLYEVCCGATCVPSWDISNTPRCQVPARGAVWPSPSSTGTTWVSHERRAMKTPENLQTIAEQMCLLQCRLKYKANRGNSTHFT